MKTETQVTIKLGDIRASEHLYLEPEGFLLKVFLACSRTDTKPFILTSECTALNQFLRIVNIGGKQLQFWLCSTHNKIIANAIIPLPQDLGVQHEVSVDFKMTATTFALVNMALIVNRREIEKQVIIEPDEELLKKVEDPYEKLRKQQEEAKRLKQLEEKEAANKQVKKAAITVTHLDKKQVPFV